jgi:alpha-galactosidase/6-phospho-beta-glucosidase family protein
MKLNNYSKSSQLIARSSILKQAIVCIAACFFSWSAWATNCYDITAGSIGSSQTICTGGNPAMFTNITSATTGQGTGVKYIWLRYVGASAPASSSTWGVTTISGATGATYDPPAGSVTAKTWFRRCSAPNSSWCSTYNGETSWVSVSVTTCVNCNDITAGSIGSSQTICTGGDPATFTNTASATTGQGTGVKYIWLRYVGASAPTSSTMAGVTTIAGATGATYDPPAGSVTAKTWFRRCSAPNSATCTTYYGETTWVSVSVSAPTALTCEASVNGTWSTLSSCSVSACTGNSLWLSVNPNVSTVTWTGPNGFTASGNDALISNSVTTANAGTYTAALTQNGCTSTTTIQVSITSCGVNCNDITAGSIGSNQSICTGGDPAIINNLTAATTGQGTGVKYVWLQYIGALAPTDATLATIINGATGASYDPPAGSVTAKTWFRRCAAPNSPTCTTYNGETSWVSVDVTTCATNCNDITAGSIGSNQSICTGGDPAIINNLTAATTGQGTGVKYVWLQYIGALAPTDATLATIINGATGASYDPPAGSVTAKTWFRRCAAPNSPTCTTYNGETSWVSVDVTSVSASIAGTTAICSGGSTTLTASGGGTYVWSTGATTAAVTVNPTANTTYTVTVTNGGCTATATRAVTVGTVSASIAGTTAICSGGSTTLTASGGGTYVWSTGATTAAVTVNPTANTTYTVTVTNGGCTATATRAVTVGTISASIAGTTAICSGGSTTLTASGGGTYVWSTGATTAAVTVNPTANTTYTVTVTNGGCTATATRAVTVGTISASIAGTTAICSGGSTTLTASGGGTYVWSTGSTTAAINVNPTANTTYTVTVTNGSCTATATTVVTVGAAISSGITSPSTTCALENVLVQAQNVDATCTYSWNFGVNATPQTATGTSATTQFSAAAVGTAQTITLTVTKNGCSATFTKNINVTPEVFANAGPDKEICQGGSTQIGGNPAGPAGGTFTWSPNTFLNSNTVANPIASPPVTTTYTLTTTLNGCTRTDQVVVSVNVALNPNADAGGSKTVCSGQSVQIGGNPTSTSTGVSYVWSPANSLSGAYVANPTAYPTTNTTYTVTVTNTATGCSATSSAAVTVTSCVTPALSINDITVTEGTNPTATLQICASAASTSPITVTYTTSNGTALSGTDYTTTTATATIPAGQTCVNVTIPIIDDAINEPIETFTVTLTNPSNATIADGTGIVTILDNDVVIPTLAINDITVTEGTNPTATLQICASAASTSPITVTYTTSNGTALSGTDYTTTTATATIPAGQTCVNVTVPIIDDAINEPTENFTVTLTNPSNATIADGTGIVTILDNDVVIPTLAINDITVTEGTNPTATLQICASAASTSPITVTYTTSNGTALSGTDYTTTTATATIPAGQTCVNVTVPIIDDAINEPTENFTVTLTNPSNATIADGTGIVTILDNDPTGSTTITIGDKVFFDANNNGIQDGGSEVGLPGVTVNLYNTTGGWMGSSTTNANGLYSFSSTTISSLVPGSYRVCFNKPWNYSNVSPKDQGTDDAIDSDVNAFLSGSACTDLFTVAAGETKNTIDVGLNNGVTPTLPTLSINDITVNENAGTATLQICASATSTSPISVTYTTSNGTALSGTDYTTTTATATIPAGQTCVNVTVPITDDLINEPTETFTVILSTPTGATINDGTGIVTILDNDNPIQDVPSLNINDITVTEGTNPTATLQICASATSTSPISVTYTTSNGTALSGTDYTTTTATATIPAGQTCVNVTIPIIDDAINEPTETFTVTLTNPSNAVIGDGTGIVTILDNDPTGSTTITIGDKVFFDANNNGIQDGGSEVGLPGVTVNLFNATGGWMGSSTSNANGLYSFSSTTISSLVAGSYRVCFNKPWNYSNVSPKDQGTDDAIDSDVNAFSGGSACTDLFTVAAGETKNTIDLGLNNATTPTLPTLSINDVEVNENAGTATLQICASATSTSPITVTYTTSNGTALSGTDYTTTTATATIPAGQTCVNVSIPIVDDNINEPTETFTVILSKPNRRYYQRWYRYCNYLG